MKHTDFYNQYKYLDACTEDELKAAVKAHGNEYARKSGSTGDCI